MALDQDEVLSFEEEDKSERIPPHDVVTYNELRSCADLFRLFSTGKLEIQPDFQREVVWKRDEQTRFIDSLVKNLPIPSMCFSLDYNTQKWKVIDGLQRMTSIIRFLSKEEWILSDLEDIREELKGASNQNLKAGTQPGANIYASVEDVSIPVTVIRCDYTKSSHMQYLFTIFHRLNSGGARLTNQEIRNCIFTGSLNSFLKSFDTSNKDWILVKRRIWGPMDRFRSVEVLLRVLAFSENSTNYDGNLANFLNKYMQSHANESATEIERMRDRLINTCRRAKDALIAEPAKKISLAFIESLMIAIYNTLDMQKNIGGIALQERYNSMKGRSSFASGARYAISSAENVKRRLAEATEAFAY